MDRKLRDNDYQEHLVKMEIARKIPRESLTDLSETLEKIGVDILTGEACAFGMRLLCDISLAAQSLLSDFLGGIEFTQSAWNHSNPWKSVTLTRESLYSLAVFDFTYKNRTKTVIHVKNSNEFRNTDYLFACNWNEKDYVIYLAKEVWQCEYIKILNYPNESQPTSGSRNVHAASGRSY